VTHSFAFFLPLNFEPEIVKTIFIVSADRVGSVARVLLLMYVLAIQKKGLRIELTVVYLVRDCGRRSHPAGYRFVHLVSSLQNLADTLSLVPIRTILQHTDSEINHSIDLIPCSDVLALGRDAR